MRFAPPARLLLLVLTLTASLPAATVTLTDATVVQLQAAMTAGTITSEKLTQLFLARIDAYEKAGPKLHAIITLNPRALDEARALDAERKAGKIRGPLHGIPILLKDNIDTADLPTTGGFYALRDSIPPQDAEQTRRLRVACCVIIAKANLSEFASGAAISTLGGQILNPHVLDRTPSGSSGGTGAGIAAGFAAFGLGTDTGGSIRGPSSSNGIAGLKPTLGLNGRGGIIPLSLALDTVGPMARNVAGLAPALNVMAGPDPRDPATAANAGKIPADYTAGLRPDALRGARLGLLRDFMKIDSGVDAVMETAVAILRRAGATVVEIKLPRFVLGVNSGLYLAIRDPEFRAQIEGYLATLSRKDLPKTHDEIIALSEKITEPTKEGWVPNKNRLEAYRREKKAGTLDDKPYHSALEDGRKIVRENLEWIIAREKLDAFIVPTSSRPPRLIKEADAPPSTATVNNGSAAHLGNLSGWPDLIVPAGFTSDPVLPVALSFIGPAFSEPRLLALGYAFEQAMPARMLPVTTPALAGETITY
ncbi:MAG: glutamyl-tRNA amidotransferase [Undibacterium sp.]|nr:glutamyl-tRNA amidotransferase [Opitutaceae bacterium]